jgi:hypothetical protein
MNLYESLTVTLLEIMGTEAKSFPQTHLGFPLSSAKLPQSAFQFLLDRFDRYLAGWKAALLSKGGRLALLAAALDSLPTYFMASLLLPILILQKIDRKRKSFFWAGDDHYSGAQCLVAWDSVCLSKPDGGIGVKNLRVQNVCLLLKFCYKTLHNPTTPWNIWITNLSPYPVSQGNNSSFLGKNINKHMDTLRSVTQCSVGNGKATSFWLDRWILPEPLANAFLAIFSHHLHPYGLVSDIMQEGVQNALRNRLTSAASSELASFLSLLQVF